MFFFREIGRSVGNWEALPDGPEVRSGFYAARNYMVPNKSWGSHKSANTFRVWRARVRIINFPKSTINFTNILQRRLKNATSNGMTFSVFFHISFTQNTNNNISKFVYRTYLCQWVRCYFEKLHLFLEKLPERIK